MVCYDKGRIYGIYNEDGVCVYVGSTCQTISRRKAEHKRDYDRTPERPIYRYVKEHGGWEGFDFRLIAEVSCENREQLCREEGKYIRQLKPEGNRQVAGRSKAEYQREVWYKNEINHEKHIERMRKYRLRKREEKEISSTSSDSEGCLL